MTRPGRSEEEDRVKSIAGLAPLIALILLAPPLINLFVRADVAILGAPPAMIFVFTLWLGMILAAALLARRLRRIARRDATSPSAEGD